MLEVLDPLKSMKQGEMRRVRGRECVNSRVKTLSGGEPCVFTGMVAPAACARLHMFAQNICFWLKTHSIILPGVH